MNKVYIGLSIVLLFAVFIMLPRSRFVLKLGAPAPAFTLADENGNMVALPKTGKVALVFFPKAHPLSFACKKEVCSIRDGFADLKEQGITVYGLTNSSQAHMKSFVESNHLPFLLLHATAEVMKAYGVSGGLLGAKRHTILIDNDQIIGVITSVELGNHPQQILAGFQDPKKS